MRFSDVFNYGLSLFFPLLLPAVFIVPGSLLSLVISPDAQFLFLFLATLITPVAVIIVLFYLCSRFSDFKQRLLINYLGWTILGCGAIYLCTAAIGGTSMAVVEGAVDPAQFRRAALGEAITLLLYAQVVIIPLCFWATRRTSVLFDSTRKIAADEA